MSNSASTDNMQASSRMLPFAKVLNFRDVGGYATVSGRRVRSGIVYRAGRLGGMTTADRQLFADLGIRLVFDVRSDEEVERHPDRLNDSAEITYINRPMRDPSRLTRTRAVLQVALRLKTFEQMMLQGYIDTILEANAPVIGEFFQRIVDGEAPAVIHCTAGKDRTGITIALLLRLLGVSQQDVVADFALSNQFSERFAANFAKDPRMNTLLRLGYKPSDLTPLFTCEPSRLIKALHHIDRTYGTIPNYLKRRANFSLETQAKLKDLLLE